MVSRSRHDKLIRTLSCHEESIWHDYVRFAQLLHPVAAFEHSSTGPWRFYMILSLIFQPCHWNRFTLNSDRKLTSNHVKPPKRDLEWYTIPKVWTLTKKADFRWRALKRRLLGTIHTQPDSNHDLLRQCRYMHYTWSKNISPSFTISEYRFYFQARDLTLGSIKLLTTDPGRAATLHPLEVLKDAKFQRAPLQCSFPSTTLLLILSGGATFSQMYPNVFVAVLCMPFDRTVLQTQASEPETFRVGIRQDLLLKSEAWQGPFFWCGYPTLSNVERSLSLSLALYIYIYIFFNRDTFGAQSQWKTDELTFLPFQYAARVWLYQDSRHTTSFEGTAAWFAQVTLHFKDVLQPGLAVLRIHYTGEMGKDGQYWTDGCVFCLSHYPQV